MTMTPAQRKKLQRERKDAGVLIGDSVEVFPDAQRRLVESGLATQEELQNPQSLGRVISDLVDCWDRGTLSPKMSRRDEQRQN